MNDSNFNDLCERCGEYYQRRNGLCWNCFEAGQDLRAEERHDREVIERQERKEKCD